MATQSAAVMQRMNGTEIVERSSEEILNHVRRRMSSSLEGRSRFSKAVAVRRGMI